MDDPSPIPDEAPVTRRRAAARKAGRKAVKLTGREYLPMGLMLAFWAVAGLSMGHADTARLLAATVLFRAAQMLGQMATSGPVRKRDGAPDPIRRQALRMASIVQLGSLGAIAIIILLLALGLDAIGQDKVALALPLTALCMPARCYRAVDPKAYSNYFRLFTTGAGLLGAAIAWMSGGGIAAFALAYGFRDWLAALLIRLSGFGGRDTEFSSDEKLGFAEIARNTVVTSRRLLTYRLTKNILTVFGPFGNFAARTGRGLNWHARIEPYMPHKFAGFAMFGLVTMAIAAVLAVRSGQPAAMIGAAGALQLSAIALNVLLWWRFLPDRADPTLEVEMEEDD